MCVCVCVDKTHRGSNQCISSQNNQLEYNRNNTTQSSYNTVLYAKMILYYTRAALCILYVQTLHFYTK